jgi:hypothetical protein
MVIKWGSLCERSARTQKIRQQDSHTRTVREPGIRYIRSEGPWAGNIIKIYLRITLPGLLKGVIEGVWLTIFDKKLEPNETTKTERGEFR